MEHFVYELIDPRTDAVRYVGITTDPPTRLYQHVKGYRAVGAKRAWLQELEAADSKPIMRILEKTTTPEEAQKREKHWIRKYIDQGYNLVNVQCRSARSTNRNAWRSYHIFMTSFEENGETWLCTTEAFKGWPGTRILDLAEEYCLATQIRGRTTYYRRSDLPAFVMWARKQYPPGTFRR